MNSAIKQYVFKETAISAVINSAFSFGVTYLLLGANEVVVRQELIVDALPQSFAVTLFGVGIPTLLTRKKIRGGKLATLPFKKTWLPNNAFFRAVLLGIIAAIVGGFLHLLVLTGLQIEALSITTVFIYKTLYGAALSMIVTPIALLLVLQETEKSI